LNEQTDLENIPLQSLYHSARNLESEDKIEEAIRFLEAAFQRDQSHHIAHSLARLKRQVANFEEAIKYYSLAKQGINDPSAMLISMADCFHFLHDYQSCVEVLAEAAFYSAKDSIIWWNLTLAMQELGFLQNEIDRFTDSLSNSISEGHKMTEIDVRLELATLRSQRTRIDNDADRLQKYDFMESLYSTLPQYKSDSGEIQLSRARLIRLIELIDRHKDGFLIVSSKLDEQYFVQTAYATYDNFLVECNGDVMKLQSLGFDTNIEHILPVKFVQ
jgi:tetratricopeptide (TPR) repeat protein